MASSTRGVAVDQDAVDYLAGMQVGCSGAAADQGGITSAFSGGTPDVLSTVQAVPGLAGLSLLTGPTATTQWVDDAPAFTCPVDTTNGETVAGWGSAWLEGQVAADAVTGGNAAWAVLAFASTRTGHDEAETLYTGILADLGPAPTTKKQKVVATTLATQTDESPGALGLAALAGTTLGEDVSGFGARIAATLTAAPTSSPSPSPKPSPSDEAAVGADDPTLPATGTDPALVLTGAALVLAGSGLVAGTRRRRRGGSAA
jgi:LPXTG-motif cell wall-anchored protein